jgi:hypothetical protein
MLDKADPKVKLDYMNPAKNFWNKQGDSKAITISCDKELTDKGPEPDIAATRVPTESSISTQPTEAKSTEGG